MPERIVTMPGSTDQFVLTERPAPALTDRYRPLPDGINSHDLLVIRANEVRTGDVVTALFTEGPGIRRMEHVPEPFAAHPRPFGICPAHCEECSVTHLSGGTTDRYMCLNTADDYTNCAVVYPNAPVAIIPADTAAEFPPLDSTPQLPDLFTLDDGEHGPYEALPVPRAWSPFATISVTRATAEKIAADIPGTHAGRHLTFRWLHDTLLIASDPRLRTDPGRPGRLIEPDADGRYRIGGLWRWEEWSVPFCPNCGAETEPLDVEGERVWRCTAPDCTRRTYGTGNPDDDDELPSYTEDDGLRMDALFDVRQERGEIDIEATAELAAPGGPDEDEQDAK
ncbi:hypothetical protein [Streptomyces sp. NPDC058371]|uniref:hypothetical protein n=1 Tax=Streptomyces sp. NPDC058371 TaxID=3346463 RepID=UPI003665D60B